MARLGRGRRPGGRPPSRSPRGRGGIGRGRGLRPRRPGPQNLPGGGYEQDIVDQQMTQQQMDRDMMQQQMEQGGGQPGEMKWNSRRSGRPRPLGGANKFGMNRLSQGATRPLSGRPKPSGGRRGPQTRNALSQARMSEEQYGVENQNIMSNVRDARNRRPSRKGGTPSRNSRMGRGRRY